MVAMDSLSGIKAVDSTAVHAWDFWTEMLNRDDVAKYVHGINSARFELNQIAQTGYGLADMQVWMETFLTPEGWSLYLADR